MDWSEKNLIRRPDGEGESRARNALIEIGRFINHAESARLVNTSDHWRLMWLAGAYAPRLGGLTVELRRFYGFGPNPLVMLTSAFVLPQDLEAPSGEGRISVLELIAETTEDRHMLQMVRSKGVGTRFYKQLFERDDFWRSFAEQQRISLGTMSGVLKGGLLCDIGVNGLPPDTGDIPLDVFPFPEISRLLQTVQKPDSAITANMAGFYIMRMPHYAYEREVLPENSSPLLLP